VLQLIIEDVDVFGLSRRGVYVAEQYNCKQHQGNGKGSEENYGKSQLW